MIVVLLLFALVGCSKNSPTTGNVAARSEVEARPAAAGKPEAAAPAAAPVDEAAVMEQIQANDTRPVIRLSSGSGAAGSTVSLDGSLEVGQGGLAAISTEIWYDPTLLRVAKDASGQPDCQINNDIGPSSGTKKQIYVRERMVNQDAILRIALIGMDNANAVPDGKLFSCRFSISNDAKPGTMSLAAQSTAAGLKAQVVPVKGSQATIVVN